MTLSEIRQLFVQKSGRFDLMDEDGNDTGADFFIQAGSRLLDRLSDLKNVREGTFPFMVGEDGLIQLAQLCYLVRRVLAYIGGEKSTPLPLKRVTCRHSLKFLMGRKGRPLFYALKATRYVPDLKRFPASEAGSMKASALDMADCSLLVEVLPHPTKELLVEVQGCFYSAPLLEDNDSNVWAEQHPEILLKAALYELEIFYRNTEGANDWLSSIRVDLSGLEQLEVMADIEGKGVMGI